MKQLSPLESDDESVIRNGAKPEQGDENKEPRVLTTGRNCSVEYSFYLPLYGRQVE